MINLVLVTGQADVKTVFISIWLLVLICIIVGIVWGIYKNHTNKKNYENACENQHLMFNQLKEGDFIWKVYKDKITPYEVIGVDYVFSGGECRKIKFNIQSLKSTWVYEHEIDAKNVKSYKDGFYYLIYKEAKLVADACRHKMDKEIANIKKVSIDDIEAGVDAVIKRVENIKKEYE